MNAQLQETRQLKARIAYKHGSERWGVKPMLSVWLVVVVGGLLSAISLFALIRSETNLAAQKATLAFYADANERIGSIRREINKHLQTNHALEAFFEASESVTREEFHIFATRLLETRASIQALEWIPRVPHSERARYEAEADEFVAGFKFTERNKDGALIPAVAGDEYYPVYFVEPNAGNEAALGFNLASEPTRLETLQRARDSGQAAASGRVLLVQQSRQYGLLLCMPIYRNGSSLMSVAERRQHIKGFVLTVYHLGKLVGQALVSLSKRAVDVWLLDTSANPDTQLLHYQAFGAETTDGTRKPPSTGLEFSEIVPIGGRQWRILATPALGSSLPPLSATPWVVFVAGLLFTGLLAFHLYAVQKHSVQLIHANLSLDRQVAERKQVEVALREGETELRHLSRTYAVLSRCNHILARASDEVALLNAFCQALVEVEGPRWFAWVGYAEKNNSESVQVMAHAGHTDDQLSVTAFSWSDSMERCDPAGMVHRTGEPEVLNDIEGDTRFASWRDVALGQGYRSMIVLPLRVDGSAVGNLSIFSPEKDAFDQNTVTLFRELAADLAYGIQTLRARTAREQKLRLLREEVEREEQKRLAAALHDGIGQSLQAVNLGLKQLRARAKVEGQATRELLDRLIEEVGNVIVALRKTTHELRPPFLERMELLDAVRFECHELAERAGISIYVASKEDSFQTDRRVKEQCFLGIHEALNNAITHAEANRIDVIFEPPTSRGRLTIRVLDKGKGFDTEKPWKAPSGLGLSMISERAESVGGRAEIHSAPGDGTTISIEVPLKTRAL